LQTTYPILHEVLGDRLFRNFLIMAHNELRTEKEFLDRFERDLSSLKRKHLLKKKKIREKIHANSISELKEKAFDYMAELDAAKLFLDHVEELDVSLPSGQDADCLVNLEGQRIYIEVKRIRRTREEKDSETQIDRIRREIGRLPSPFCFSLEIGETLESMTITKEIADAIITRIQDTIDVLATCSPIEGEMSFSLSDIQEGLGSFSLCVKDSSLGNQGTELTCYRYPFPETDKDASKELWDDIDEKAAKFSGLPYDAKALIFLKVDSNIYSRFDLEGITVHHRRVSGRLKESWITYGVNEVFKRHRIIGGIIYRGDWEDR